MKSKKQMPSKYAKFLKQAIAKHCNEQGYFVAEYDSSDTIDPEHIRRACVKRRADDRKTTKQHLVKIISETYLDNIRETHNDAFLDMIVEDIMSSGNNHIIDCYSKRENTFEADLKAQGYKGIDVNTDKLIETANVNINIMFATESEQNSNMKSIPTAYGNRWRMPDVSNRECFDNILTYLIHQQGYTIADILKPRFRNQPSFMPTPFSDENETAPFIRSLMDEIASQDNIDPDASAELTALVSLKCKDMLNFFDYICNPDDDKYLVLPDDTHIGIFDEWTGTGSNLAIRLEKDFAVPIKYIRKIQIEDCYCHHSVQNYTIDDVYTLDDCAWTKVRFNELCQLISPSDEDRRIPDIAESDITEILDKINEKDKAVNGYFILYKDCDNETRWTTVEDEDDVADAVKKIAETYDREYDEIYVFEGDDMMD